MWVNGSLSHDSFKSECKICRKVSVFFFNYTSRHVEFSTESLINRSLNYHTSWHEHISNAKSKELFIDAIYKWQSLMERTWDWDYIFKLNNFLNSFQQYVHMWVSLQPWTKMESFSALHLLRHRLWELCICWLVVCFTLFPCLVQICFHALYAGNCCWATSGRSLLLLPLELQWRQIANSIFFIFFYQRLQKTYNYGLKS